MSERSLLISENLRRIKSEIPEGVLLVAVSKFQPVEAVKAAYDAGQRVFGESRVQELTDKIPQLPSDIKWHFIGHLQTNKVKHLIGKTSLIESVDSVRLLEIIDEESRKKDVFTQVLLQVHVAREETKFGFSPEELRTFFKAQSYRDFSNTVICGLMAMATNTDDIDTVRGDFATAAALFREIKAEIPANPLTLEPLIPFRYLSMGMSGDWPLAVEEGADIIRIGSSIFGPREY